MSKPLGTEAAEFDEENDKMKSEYYCLFLAYSIWINFLELAEIHDKRPIKILCDNFGIYST